MRFLKIIVLCTLSLIVLGNIGLFALAFVYQWVPDSLALGFSLAAPLELAISGLIRMMEEKNKKDDDEGGAAG